MLSEGKMGALLRITEAFEAFAVDSYLTVFLTTGPDTCRSHRLTQQFSTTRANRFSS